MCSVSICSWWWDVHTCIYFVSSVVFVYFQIKSSFQNKVRVTLCTGFQLTLDVTKTVIRNCKKMYQQNKKMLHNRNIPPVELCFKIKFNEDLI